MSFDKLLTGVDPKDLKYVRRNPDADFSPEHNKAVIEQTIKDYEAQRAKKAREKDDHYAERADAVVTYLKSLSAGGKGSSNLLRYFGKRNLAYLRGQDIRDKLMGHLIKK